MSLCKAMPCPYCHNTRLQYLSKSFEGEYESTRIYCPSCGTAGPVASGIGSQEDAATEKWNALPRVEGVDSP